jgi:hypothetical protein
MKLLLNFKIQQNIRHHGEYNSGVRVTVRREEW